MNIEITNFDQYRKNTLQGFVSVLLTEPGVEISGIAVHEKDDKRWLQLPAKPYKKSDGKTGWSYLICFREKKNYQRFQNATLKLLMLFSARIGGIEIMGIPTRINQNLLKIDQAILSLLAEFKRTEENVNALSSLLNRLIWLQRRAQ